MRRLRLPAKLHAQHPGRKWAAAGLIALLSAGLAWAARNTPGVRVPLELLDNVLYDATYRFRTTSDRSAGDIVLVVVDDRTLDELAKAGQSWPFPRDLWGKAAQYLDDCGAKTIAFDILFETPSGYAKILREAGKPTDDEELAVALNGLQSPPVLAMMATVDGKPGPFALKLKKSKLRLGAVNLRLDKTARDYEAAVHGLPSLATKVAESAGAPSRAWAAGTFRLHYHGPTQRADGGRTYTYLSLTSVLAAAEHPADAEKLGVPATLFKNKVVLLGATAAGTYDLKSSPLSDLYPGVEVQATAIDNLLHNQYVHTVSGYTAWGWTFAGVLLAALGVLLPRKTSLKLLGAMLATAGLVGSALLSFCAATIYWLPLAAPLLALMLATVGALAWSYYAEDRNRRLIVKALAQYVSPSVAAKIERDPTRIRFSGDRHVMTVMFTDIEGFTSLSEKLEDDALTELLNFYFDEMSPLVFREDGTLDKYIGDAIMSFWNAPLPQADHAVRACRAALAVEKREAEIQPEMNRLGADRCLTRIGINTGPMVVGDMGSQERFNYTVLGDSVNLGARLEGANKFYGSRILMSQTTADLVKEKFIARKLDVLQVKGKKQPMAVYELLAERGLTEAEPAILDRAARYESAWEQYRQQNWNGAEAALLELLSHHSTDKPAAMLLTRVIDLRSEPPEPEWDGVYVAKGK